jgi:hypothetical protein
MNLAITCRGSVGTYYFASLALRLRRRLHYQAACQTFGARVRAVRASNLQRSLPCPDGAAPAFCVQFNRDSMRSKSE